MEAERATKFIHELLDLLVKQNGSDLFITANFPPAIKIDGKIVPQSSSTHIATVVPITVARSMPTGYSSNSRFAQRRKPPADEHLHRSSHPPGRPSQCRQVGTLSPPDRCLRQRIQLPGHDGRSHSGPGTF